MDGLRCVMRFLLPICLFVACTPEVVPQYGVATELLISRVDDAGVSSGFDLDGINSLDGDGTGCNIADYVNELGETGVDNAVARLVPILEQTEAIAAEDLIHQAINSGELLILFEMKHYTGEGLNDDDVMLSVMRAYGTPIVGPHGDLVASQTFDIDPSVTVTGQDGLTLTDGLVTASDLTLEIPLEIFDAKLTAILENASARVIWNEDGSFTGYMGGSLDYWSIIDMAMNSNVDQALAESLPLLFGANADLMPDAGGQCTRISFTFTFKGVSAYVFEDGVGYPAE